MATKTAEKKKFRLPHLGMRIVKTGICVFFCLLLNYLFSAQVALISSLAAIVSMQSTLESTMKTAVSRFVGTAIGGIGGMILLPMAQQIETDWMYLIIMPIGMIFIIYVCVLVKMPGSASICAFVYITVLIVPFNPSSHGNPYLLAFIRIADTAVGVTIALLVNRFIAPPKPKPITSVHIPSNTFKNIYAKVADAMTGTEELILFDTRLIHQEIAGGSLPEGTPERDVMAHGRPEACKDTVSVPVPTEFKSLQYLNAVYIGPHYVVIPMHLRQKNGYVDLPCELYPVTVAWHVDTPEKKETYGFLHHANGTLRPASLHSIGRLRAAMHHQSARGRIPKAPSGLKFTPHE